MPGVVCNGKDVWLLVSNLLVTVALDVLRIIDGQLRVGVHGNQDGARVGLQVCVCVGGGGIGSSGGVGYLWSVLIVLWWSCFNLL